MSINIHGKEYVTVAERLQEIHKKLEKFSITTEVVLHSPVVVKATVSTEKGVFTGFSAANPSKSIEKVSPYEVAETSAVGRALIFAGFTGGNGGSIASAEEIAKAIDAEEEAFITEEQVAVLRDHIIAVGADEKKFLAYLKVEAIESVLQSQFNKAVAALKAKAKKVSK
jgi:hypothetical protein